ncbi:beta/gamma crystallin domain-containing protein 1 isoform X1 [Monodelphis domestica]|uniref:beta/gamma crystallin domain-containing protein 1 isoform X1 n=1 Tax=Monodelphis domestica TaxID=13616 RepID=UPI0024E272D2|nr:beta/gamma crystallin domain-containing protein 1 isoform X1 [Monodelphis domestica]
MSDQGGQQEVSPTRTTKKHASFNIWRIKKKHQNPADWGVFIPHPPPPAVSQESETPVHRVLEPPPGNHEASEETPEYANHYRELQVCEVSPEVQAPLSADTGVLKKSRAQPPEENKRKPVLGKLGNLFTAGRKRNSRNGSEGPTNSVPKLVSSSKLLEREKEKSKTGTQPRNTDGSVGSSLTEKTHEPENDQSQATSLDAELSSCLSNTETVAAQLCDEGDSSKLEPSEQERDTFPDPTAAAKDLPSKPEYSSRQESSELLAPSLEKLSGSSHPTEENERCLTNGSLGCAEERDLGPEDFKGHPPENSSVLTSLPKELSGNCLSNLHTENTDSKPEVSNANSKTVLCGPDSKGTERAPPAKVLTLDIYLRKTEEVSPADEPVVVSLAEDDCSDPEEMEKRSNGRRSGRRRKSQKSTDSPNGDKVPVETHAREDSVFVEDVAPDAVAEKSSGEKKVKSPQAATAAAVPERSASASGNPDPKTGAAHLKGHQRGDSDKSRQSQLPTVSPTKRKGRSRQSEASPLSPPGGYKNPGKDSPSKKQSGTAPDGNSACTPKVVAGDKSAAALGQGSENGEEGAAAAKVIPRELTVKSSTLLPEIRPEHKRSSFLNNLDGRAEGGRNRGELGRLTASSDPDNCKHRSHLGATRATVTTKINLPAKPKHVELNFKAPKNLESLGNDHNPFSQPVHKGNTANKISLFENKRANNSPRNTDSRGVKSVPPSKTFVGRAKLNLGKKSKEIELLEKRGNMQNNHPNGGLSKEVSMEKKTIPPEEHILPVTANSGETTADCQPGPTEKADVQRDPSCPSEQTDAAQIPSKDVEILAENSLKTVNSTGLVLENKIDLDKESKDSTQTVPIKSPADVLDLHPVVEMSNGPSIPQSASVSMAASEDTSVRCDGDAAPAGSHSGADLKEFSQPSLGSGGRAECDLPASCENSKMTPNELGREDRSPESVEDPLNSETCEDKPSKVRVHVRSYVLPVETAQSRAPHIILDSSEVEEVRMTSYYNDGDEVDASHSCTSVKDGVPDTKATSPKDVECKGEHPEKSRLPLELEKTVSIQAPSDDSKIVMATESSPANSQGSKSSLELLPRPSQDIQDVEGSPASGLNVSVGSDDSTFDSSADMEKFTEIIKKMDSSICVPQKKKKARIPNSPAPHFAMPPIHEDNLEKVFDPNTFTYGLGKKRENQQDASPGLHLFQGLDTKSKLRPKRSSAEQSILFKSANTSTKNELVECPETNGKENKDIANGGIKRSRLEKSALFSSMLSSSASTPEKVFSPSVTSVNTMTTSFGTSQNSSLLPKPAASKIGSDGIPGLSAQSSNSENELHRLPSANSSKIFNFDSSSKSLSGLRSPNYVEKYLQTGETKRDPDSRNNLTLTETRFSEFSKLKNNNGIEKTTSLESTLKPQMPNFGSNDTDFMSYLKPSIFEPSISLAGMTLSDTPVFKASMQNKINPRPGKVVIYSEPTFSGNCFEVFSDIPNCTSWSLSPVIIVKVVRGCWILYEKPNFEGNSVPLEEGELELCDPWRMEDILVESEEDKSAKPMVIGSIRHVIKDYRISHIDLFTETEGLGLVNSYFDDTEEMQMYGAIQKTCSIKVHWGTWLVYEEPDFQGIPFVLEPGEYPDLAFWGTEEAYIGSMRPLKMGGRKVEFPTDPKVIIYEKPFFEGKCMELETEICNFITEGDETEEAGEDNLHLKSVGSIKVLGGIWVAFEKPGFTGHQYLLEEGEYKEWQDWGGYDGELKSLRPILGDFSNAHMIMYSERNFGTKGSNIDVLGIVANLKDTGYGVKTQSINVLNGVWVAYENPDFTGEQYILDKGLYTSFEDWGGKNCKISSVQPICLDTFTSPKERNKVHLFSEPEFCGSSKVFEETTNQIEDSFSAKSCRVLGGSWVAYDGENFSGNQYVLEEGHYPSLSAMGCPPETNFKSLRFIDVEFSEPTIVLFEREDFKGKKIELNEEVVNLRFLGFNTQIRSIQVIGGIWVTYEFSNYRGRQILLSPAEVPNWYEFSGCRQIGSLRPFIQKRIYFRLRNKATGFFMSTNGNLEDLKLLRIQVMEDVGADDQIWIYQEGCIKCRIAEDCCLTIVGSLVTSGSKLGLALDQNEDSQFWSIKSDGRIYSKLKPNLVLDIKGGAQYDQNHIILNTANQEKMTQVWEALIL